VKKPENLLLLNDDIENQTQILIKGEQI